jgi:SNF2 family DNA or RNA helicase
MRLKQVFTKLAEWQTAPFVLTDTPIHAADIKWFMERYPLTCSISDRRRLNREANGFYAEQVAAESILLPEWVPTDRAGLRHGQKLRPYQRVAIDLVEQVNELIILDDVGLGKTYEGLGIALIEGALPLVIVCQPHLQLQWQEKAEAFVDLNVVSVHGTKPYDLPQADIYIIKYSQLSGWVDVLSQGWIRALAFDEVQELRHGQTTMKGAAAHRLCEVVREVSGCLVGLTATLIYNYGIEAYNIVNMFRPGLLGTRDQFLREYCETDASGKGIVRDPDALGAFLQESLMVLRRTKRSVGQEAKQLDPELEWVEPNSKAVSDAEELAKQLAITTLTGSFAESGIAAREFDMRMREMTGIAKAHATASFVRMFVESGQPVLLFGWHREVYEIWQRELADLNPVMYTGSETAVQKERAKQDFIAGKTNLMIMSLRSGAGADGIQHRCSTAIFGELDFSPLVHLQCTGRLDRDGQLDPVYAYYVVTNYGSDPVLIDILGLKQSQSDGIHDPGEKQAERQSDPDRIKRMARRYLESRGVDVDSLVTQVPSMVTDEQLALI